MYNIQYIEDCEYEDNARYDYLSEAYGATIRDCLQCAIEDAFIERVESDPYEGWLYDEWRWLEANEELNF